VSAKCLDAFAVFYLPDQRSYSFKARNLGSNHPHAESAKRLSRAPRFVFGGTSTLSSGMSESRL
jgi:hypothetical protein